MPWARGRVSGIVALLLVLAARHVLAQGRIVDTPELKGAYGLIVIPEGWQPETGGLFLYAHGYTADRRLLRPFKADLSDLDPLFVLGLLPLERGYAIATTTFRSVGWYVKDAVKDIENLRRYFVRRYGKPKHTYLWGHSGGGMVTSTVIEYFPDLYDGAAPMCGPSAGARRNFNGAFDIRVLFEWVCRDVPESRFTCRICSGGQQRCLREGDCPAGETCGEAEAPPPPELGLSRECTEFLLAHPDRFSETTTAIGGDFVDDRVAACLGDGTDDTPDQRERRRLFVAASQLPESFITTDMFFATIGMAEVVHRRTGGKPPWGNLGVRYDSPRLAAAERERLNAEVYRAANHPAATRYLRRWYEPRGRTRSKVLTVHALDDGLVIPENQNSYRDVFAAARRADQLVQLFTTTGGHCLFVSAVPTALDAITSWVEAGRVPDPASLRDQCPACGFTLEQPGSWGTRSPERRQKGVPLRQLACDPAEPADCPAEASCSPRRLRCR